MKIVKVVCGIIWKDGKIFIARRKPEKSMGGYWEFPGGKIESDENEEQALKRELKEELGMNVIVGKRLGQNIHNYESITIELIAYECKFISASYQLSDHDEYNFVNPKNLINFNIAPADMFFVDILNSKLEL